MTSRFRRVTRCLYITGLVGALAGCTSIGIGPAASRPVTTTVPGMPLGHYPPVGLRSEKAQIDAFVAYFTAKGFPQTDMRAAYFPSGRVQTFHYHAARLGSVVTVDIDGSAGKTSISTRESGGTTTTSSSSYTVSTSP